MQCHKTAGQCLNRNLL